MLQGFSSNETLYPLLFMAAIRDYQRAYKARPAAGRRADTVAKAMRRRRLASRRTQTHRFRRDLQTTAAATAFVVHRDPAEAVEDPEEEDIDGRPSDGADSDGENAEPADEHAAPRMHAVDLGALGDISALFHAVSLDDTRGRETEEGATTGEGGCASDREVVDNEERLRALAKERDARPYGPDETERGQPGGVLDDETSNVEDSSDEEAG